MKEAAVPLVPESDLHCHLLPAWDDGPRLVEESLEMAARAAAKGLRTIAVTPHVGRKVSSRPERPAHEIAAACAHLESEIRARGIDLKLVPGAELTLAATDLGDRIASEPWLTYGGMGSYVLLESTFHCWPEYTNAWLFELALKGVTAIIAHPERLPDVQRNPALMELPAQQGSLLQITAGCLFGEEGRVAKACALQLLRDGLVSLVASDAHNARAVAPADIVDCLCSIVGDDAARQILIENPRLVLEGKPAHPPRPAPKAGKFGAWLPWNRIK